MAGVLGLRGAGPPAFAEAFRATRDREPAVFRRLEALRVVEPARGDALERRRRAAVEAGLDAALPMGRLPERLDVFFALTARLGFARFPAVALTRRAMTPVLSEP